MEIGLGLGSGLAFELELGVRLGYGLGSGWSGHTATVVLCGPAHREPPCIKIADEFSCAKSKNLLNNARIMRVTSRRGGDGFLLRTIPGIGFVQ